MKNNLLQFLFAFFFASSLSLSSASALERNVTYPELTKKVVLRTSEPVVAVDNFSQMWSGAYVGMDLGYLIGKLNQNTTSPVDDKINSKYYNNSSSIIGLLFGANFAMPYNLVLGVEGNLTTALSSTINQDIIFQQSQIKAGESSQYKAQFNSFWTGAARIRIGYAVNRFLPFMAVGANFHNYERVNGLTDKVNNSAYITVDQGSSLGVTAGVGFDYLLKEDVILRGEYRYSNYGKLYYHDFDQKIKEYDFSPQEMRLAVIYKF